MGNIFNKTPENNEVYDSETIRKNIINAFSKKKNQDYTAMYDTLNWAQNGGLVSRNRYDEFHPEAFINNIIDKQNGGASNTQTGGMASADLQLIKKHIIEQTGGKSSCPCSAQSFQLSTTSQNSIDYSVLAGGGKKESESDKEEDEEDEEDDDEDDDDEDDDEDEEDEDEEDEEDINKKDKKNKDTDTETETTQEGGISSVSDVSSISSNNIIRPFYSSEQSSFDLSRRRRY